jgi:hypothetical protein
MHDPVCRLPRITLPRTPVNKGKRKGRDLDAPALALYLFTCSLLERVRPT